ncbi:hypothetical protein EW026_g2423 [Hermanssonia centrifuga]|uniref:Cyclin N-terminal domain-containing protein n=1 Tax=Hermanssonia centrifuga TaxID=98765 RepID=A0A4V6S104_9APHY|nr:hypothetical protein EW026_g2423 [Hermanssonia centrifuga]
MSISPHLPHIQPYRTQVRRTTRTTRATTVIKDKENATSRPARTTTRGKPSSTVPPPDSKLTGIARPAASTIATRAKSTTAVSSKVDPAAQGKRKREALGEVPRPPANVVKDVPRDSTTAKGKGKVTAKEAFDGVVVKKPTTTTARQPLKVVASASKTTTVTTTSRQTRSVTAQHVQEVRVTEAPRSRYHHDHTEPARLHQVREEAELEERVTEGDAMAVDPVVPVPAPRRFTAARAAAAARPSTVQRSTVVAPLSRPQNQRRAPQAKPFVQDLDEEEAYRTHKKRRTSSEAPEDDLLEVEQAVRLEESGILFEANPDGDDWEDLDAEDADDPLMVSEYVVEIFEYLKEVEQTTMPNPNYMNTQKELAWNMRGILADHIIQVHMRFRLIPETLYLAVNIIDRFLSHRVVSLAKLQLVGATCLLIAAKVEEIVSPAVSAFSTYAEGAYTEAEVLQAERYILKTLDWNLNYPNPINFLRRVSKADAYDVRVRTIAKYLLEIHCLEWRLLAAPPSLIAAASIWLARLILGSPEWTANLAHYSSYPESALLSTANIMLNYVLRPVLHHQFNRKYASKKYLKASVFVREWALSYWDEGQSVSLKDELPALKALIASQEQEADVNEYGY